MKNSDVLRQKGYKQNNLPEKNHANRSTIFFRKHNVWDIDIIATFKYHWLLFHQTDTKRPFTITLAEGRLLYSPAVSAWRESSVHQSKAGYYPRLRPYTTIQLYIPPVEARLPITISRKPFSDGRVTPVYNLTDRKPASDKNSSTGCRL